MKEERILYWLSVGAQPSDAVTRLLTRTGTMARYDRMKGGESLEVLVAEATAVEQTRSPETDDPKLTPTTQDVEPVTEGDESE